MLATVESATVIGIEACRVHVEIDVSFGLPNFQLVGLPDASVRESRDRVRAAIRNSGYEFPAHRITINLAPGDVRKAGPAFDLPIALGMLAATGTVHPSSLAGILHVGELSLDGTIQPARGVLAIAAEARRHGARALLLPHANLAEAAVVSGLTLLPVRTLIEAVTRLNQPPADWPTPAPTPLGTPGTPGTPGTFGTEAVSELSSAEQYFLMGSLLDDGTPAQTEEAVKAYRRALDEDPDLVAALINLANIRYSRDELAEAQALYERAIVLDPTYFEAHFNLGNIHHDHARYGEAEVSYREALALNNAYPDAHFYLAVTLEKMGRSVDARAHWRSYERLAPQGEWVELAKDFSD